MKKINKKLSTFLLSVGVAIAASGSAFAVGTSQCCLDLCARYGPTHPFYNECIMTCRDRPKWGTCFLT